MSTIFNYYQSAPAWSKLAIALLIVYLSYQIWSRILRTRREVQAASWILNQRRRAGIPDSDKRPFKIAKAAVDASRKQSTTSQTAASPPPATLSQSPSVQQQQHHHHHHQQTSLATSSKRPASHSGTSANLSETINSRLPTHPKSSTQNTLDHSNQIHQTASRTSEPKQHHPLITPAPSSLKPPQSTRKPKSNKPLIDKSSNQKRVLPISTDGSDPEQSDTEAERSTSRNRKKARTQNDRSNPNIPSQLNTELSTIETGPTTAKLQRKKRILSDCVSEADADQAMRIKKGRSEKVSDPPGLERTPEADDLMRLDDEEEGAEDDHVRVEVEEEEVDQEKESDQELYMVTDDGRKKKLVKIRLGSPESAESHEENNVEQRWVTHKEFRRLKQDHKLLLDDDQWDSESVISSSDSLDSETNHLSTPSKQSAERGPIWSIEGKPRSNPILPATELPLRVRPVSRPRNSLGRTRLSLPPDPASPSQLPRSRLVSPLRPSIS